MTFVSRLILSSSEYICFSVENKWVINTINKKSMPTFKRLRAEPPEVITQPSFVTIGLVKVDIKISQIALWPPFGQLIKRSCGFKSRSPSRWVTTSPSFFGHGSSASGDMMYLICQVTSQDHLIERSCEFMDRSFFFSILTFTRDERYEQKK